MYKITVIAAAAAMALSVGSAQAGGWGKSGGLLNISPNVGVGILNGSGVEILNGNGILNGNQVLSGILNGNKTGISVLDRGGRHKGKRRWRR